MSQLLSPRTVFQKQNGTPSINFVKIRIHRLSDQEYEITVLLSDTETHIGFAVIDLHNCNCFIIAEVFAMFYAVSKTAVYMAITEELPVWEAYTYSFEGVTKQ
jgi:hypothetical protein